MGPIIGALIGGGANAIFGGGGGGGLGGMLSNLMKGGLSGLFNSLSNLFGGSQQSNGANDAQQQAEHLLGDIKNLLGELLDKKNGGSCGSPSHGAGDGECGREADALSWRARLRRSEGAGVSCSEGTRVPCSEGAGVSRPQGT